MVGQVRPAVDARVRPMAVRQVRAERLDRLGRGRELRLGVRGRRRTVGGRRTVGRHLLLSRGCHGFGLVLDRVVVVGVVVVLIGSQLPEIFGLRLLLLTRLLLLLPYDAVRVSVPRGV